MRLLSALFCPTTAAPAVCLGKTFWDSKLTAWIRLRHTGRSTAPCAHETACMRARTQYVAQTIVPSRFHRHGVPEVEFKKKTPILATLRDFSKSCPAYETSICRVLQIPSRPRCHGVNLVCKLMMALTPKRLFLYLCISISLLRPYTLFSRSPLVNKTLFEIYSVILAVKRCKFSKRRPKASTDDHPSTQKLLYL